MSVLEMIKEKQIDDNIEMLEKLCFFRFETKKELKEIINKILKNMQVLGIEKKSYYDDEFQDYEYIVIIGDDFGQYIDLSVYYAKTRNEYIIIEIGIEKI